MSFFLKKRFSSRPSGFRLPNPGHPYFQHCIVFWPFLEGVGLNIIRSGINRINLGDINVGATGGWGPDYFSTDNGGAIGWATASESFLHGLSAFTIIERVFIPDVQRDYGFGPQRWETGALKVNIRSRLGQGLDFSTNTNIGGVIGGEVFPFVARGMWLNLAFSYDGSTQRVWATGAGGGDKLVEGTARAQTGTIDQSTQPEIIGGEGASEYRGGVRFQYCYVFETALPFARIEKITHDPWAPFERRVLIPVDIGISPIGLSVENLAHNSPIDSVNVESSYTLQIDAANHASRLDDCAVTISEAIALLIDNMAHGSVLDEPLITPTYTLLPQALAHAHPLDACAAYWRVDLLANGLAHVSRMDAVDVQAAPEIVIDIDGMTHGHALDAIALEYETTLSVDGLRHGHPVDAPDVSALLGLLTTLSRTDTAWRINAGQSVDNSTGVDAGWHVVEAVFDGAGSLLAVDGTPVAGNAGVRELQSLTLGAELDGSDRLTGDIGELRIYNGALTQVQRDKIRADLQAKWL